MELAADWWISPLSQDHNDYLRSLELKLPSHALRFPHHAHRRSLVGLIASICEGRQMCATARHLAVSLLDYYMDRCVAVEEPSADLRLITLTALLIAAYAKITGVCRYCPLIQLVLQLVLNGITLTKFEEREESIPKQADLNAFVITPAGGFTPEQYLKMELTMLKYFDWNIGHPTAAHFIDYYSIGAVQTTDLCLDRPLANLELCREYVQKYSQYFLAISLLDTFYRWFRPSQVCAACIASSRICLGFHVPWTIELQELTGYKYTDIIAIVTNMISVYQIDDFRHKQSKSQPMYLISGTARYSV